MSTAEGLSSGAGGTKVRQAPGLQICILEGSLEYQVEGQPPRRCNAGAALIVPAGAVHAVRGCPQRAAWLLDHDATTYEHLARLFAGHPYGAITRDDWLDNASLYWLTNTATSAARLYWQQAVTGTNFYAAAGVSLPAAVTVFPDEYVTAPRSWTEQAYHNLIYFNQAERGGHFAAWEQPQLFSEELRAAFRTLR